MANEWTVPARAMRAAKEHHPGGARVLKLYGIIERAFADVVETDPRVTALVEAARALELAVQIHHSRLLVVDGGEGLSEYVLGPTRILRAALQALDK